jgi:hypothetical protein
MTVSPFKKGRLELAAAWTKLAVETGPKAELLAHSKRRVIRDQAERLLRRAEEAERAKRE